MAQSTAVSWTQPGSECPGPAVFISSLVLLCSPTQQAQQEQKDPESWFWTFVFWLHPWYFPRGHIRHIRFLLTPILSGRI